MMCWRDPAYCCLLLIMIIVTYGEYHDNIFWPVPINGGVISLLLMWWYEDIEYRLIKREEDKQHGK